MDETKTIDLSNRFFKIIVILIAGIVLSYLGSLIYQFKNLPQNYPQQITVTGEGKAYAKPDRAIISLGMRSEAPKSQDAVDKNNKIMNDIIRSVKDLGVDEKDIKTTSYNLLPLYDYTEKGRIFKGYSLDQQAQIKIRNFEKISGILDKASSLGANTIGDLQFTVDNPETARAEARAKAIEQAKEKAISIFAQSGLKMGKLINVYDGGFGGCGIGCVSPIYGMGGDMEKAVSIAPQIQPGQTEVNATVTLTYWIK